MTTLVVEDMYTILEQDFTVNHNRRYLIEGVKIYLMMYNSPTGTFTLSVKPPVTVGMQKHEWFSKFNSTLPQ